MGQISVAAFRPFEGKEAELMAVIDDRLPILRRLGMATDREPVNMRSRDGVIIHTSEWVDDDAITRAHSHPEVLAMWERFGACSEYVKLDTLSESHDDFATFSAV